MTVEHPAKVNTLVDRRRESSDLTIAGKTLAHGQNSREQQSRVD